MKIEMTATDKVLNLSGVDCRVWEGKTQEGIACAVFVHRIAVTNGDNSEFAKSLQEQNPPTSVVDVNWTKAGYGPDERIHCMKCGKSVSTPVPPETVVRAWVECPECMEEDLHKGLFQKEKVQ